MARPVLGVRRGSDVLQRLSCFGEIIYSLSLASEDIDVGCRSPPQFYCTLFHFRLLATHKLVCCLATHESCTLLPVHNERQFNCSACPCFSTEVLVVGIRLSVDLTPQLSYDLFLPIFAVHDLVVWVLSLRARPMFCLDIRTSNVFFLSSVPLIGTSHSLPRSVIYHILFSQALLTFFLEQS
jgi:hypothetical protein